jgi:competence transcription factor ComK
VPVELCNGYVSVFDVAISHLPGLNINEHKTKYLRCTKKQHKMDGINITQTHLEQVKSFKYMRSIVNGNNSIEEEVKERIS